MFYKRKELPVVEVVELTKDSVDSNGEYNAGVVVYINEFGSKGVMTYKQFNSLYEKDTSLPLKTHEELLGE